MVAHEVGSWLPTVYFTVISAKLSLLSNMFKLHVDGFKKAWRFSRLSDGNCADSAL